MVVTESGMVTETKESQSENAESPIEITLYRTPSCTTSPGMVMDDALPAYLCSSTVPSDSETISYVVISTVNPLADAESASSVANMQPMHANTVIAHTTPRTIDLSLLLYIHIPLDSR